MEVYTFEDLKMKKLVREVGDRMDQIALDYLDLIIDVGDEVYPDGATDDEFMEFCGQLGVTFAESLGKACEKRGL